MNEGWLDSRLSMVPTYIIWIPLRTYRSGKSIKKVGSRNLDNVITHCSSAKMVPYSSTLDKAAGRVSKAWNSNEIKLNSVVLLWENSSQNCTHPSSSIWSRWEALELSGSINILWHNVKGTRRCLHVRDDLGMSLSVRGLWLDAEIVTHYVPASFIWESRPTYTYLSHLCATRVTLMQHSHTCRRLVFDKCRFMGTCCEHLSKTCRKLKCESSMRGRQIVFALRKERFFFCNVNYLS